MPIPVPLVLHEVVALEGVGQGVVTGIYKPADEWGGVMVEVTLLHG